MEYFKRKYEEIYQQNIRRYDFYERGIDIIRKEKDEVKMGYCYGKDCKDFKNLIVVLKFIYKLVGEGWML